MAKQKKNPNICIDIGEKSIKIIKMNAKGIIIKAGKADLPPLPEEPNPDYVSSLIHAIKKAASVARLPKGKNFPCVIVTGGSHIIARRFTWPEMPPEALLENAETEIVPYLPAEVSAYTISYRVLRYVVKNNDEKKESENSLAVVDVLVVAMPKNLSYAFVNAAKHAGYSPTRMDIRENTRGKLAYNSKLRRKDRPISPSFAILDIASSQINITVFINGGFYVNRYFGSSIEITTETEIEPTFDFSSNFDSTTGELILPKEEQTVLAIDADSLANEVASIIDYIHYRERNSNIDSMFLLGNEQNVPNLLERLNENLEIPVYETNEWIREFAIRSKKLNLKNYYEFLDAYGAFLSPPIRSNRAIKPKKEIKRKKKGARGAFSKSTDIEIRFDEEFFGIGMGEANKELSKPEIMPEQLYLLPANLANDIDLRPYKNDSDVFKRIVIPSTVITLIVGGAVFGAVFGMNKAIYDLEVKEQRLSIELAQYSISEAELAVLSNEFSNINNTISDIGSFFVKFPQMLPVVLAINEALPNGVTVYNISSSSGFVSVAGTARTFYEVSEFTETIREHDFFSDTTLQLVNASEIFVDNEFGSFRDGYEVGFRLTMTLRDGAGIPEEIYNYENEDEDEDYEDDQEN